MNLPEHLDPEKIYDLREGRLDANCERAAEAHLLRCAACRTLREECEATIGALHWYGQQSPIPPEGYWAGFWSRWPLAGGIHGARRWRVPSLVAAAVALLAVGLWWAVERRPLDEPEWFVASATTAFGPTPAPPARDLVAGTAWEGDLEMLERVTFAVGSVDPLSKGVALTSLAEEP